LPARRSEARRISAVHVTQRLCRLKRKAPLWRGFRFAGLSPESFVAALVLALLAEKASHFNDQLAALEHQFLERLPCFGFYAVATVGKKRLRVIAEVDRHAADYTGHPQTDR